MTDRNKGKQGYKNTKVGWIPEEWDCMSFGDSFASIMDGTHFSPKSKIGSKKYITSKNIRKGFLDIAECSHISDEEHDEIFKKCPVRFGQVLLTKDGANAGNACLNPLEEEFSLLSSVAVLDGKPTVLTNRYAIQWILSSRGQYGLLSTISGQAITRFTLEAIAGVTIFLPPLPEQKAITSVLECWDRTIHKYEDKIEKKKNIKKGLMQRLLSGKQRLPGFSGEWKKVKLSSVARVNKEALGSRTPTGYEFFYIDLSSVCEGRISFPKKKIVFDKSPSRARRKFKNSDILMSTVRPYLHGHCFVDFPSSDKICSTGFAVISGNERELDPRFFYIHLFGAKLNSDIQNLITGSNYPAISSSDVKNLRLNLPPFPEQQAIANVLSAADAEIKALENKLDLVRGQKKYLLNNLVTGTIRLPEFRVGGGVE